MSKFDLCLQCGEEMGLDIPPSVLGMRLQIPSSIAKVEQIIAHDPRYTLDAYAFLHEALVAACAPGSDSLTNVRSGDQRHLSAQEVLEAIRQLALRRYGKQAKTVLNGWGVHNCEDIGEIVFNLIDAGLLARRPEDRREDFQGGYNFDEAFPEA